MRSVAMIIGGAGALLSLAVAPVSPAGAADVPEYFNTIVGTETATPAEIGTKNVLQLNTTMFELYGDAGQIFRKNILAKHPVILGLFSGAGGRFILYRPGMAPLDAPSVPIAISCSSRSATARWRWPRSSFPTSTARTTMPGAPRSQPTARACRPRSTASTPPRCATTGSPISRAILQNNIAFMDETLKANAISPDALAEFAKKQGPLLKKNIAWAAQTQVGHWMEVIGGWKQVLGADWDKTYAASNTIYVARQNNVLFSVLAQFFPPDAINDRLMLIETISFTTTPDDMLDSLTRIIADRPVGRCLFRQQPPDGLRADGRRRAPGDHRRGRKARHPGEPAAAGSVRLAPVADAGHARAGPEEPRRPAVIPQN